MATDDGSWGGQQGFSNDELYDILADKRRRYAIHYLKQREEPVTVRELAEQVAAWENDKAVDDLRSQERKRVYIALYQSHLSSMAEAGLISYDDEAGTVELSSEVADLNIYLEVVPRADVPWSVYYVGLAIADALILGLAWYDVRPFTAVPDLGWGLIVLITFALSAFAQIYSTKRMRIGDEGPPPDISRADRG